MGTIGRRRLALDRGFEVFGTPGSMVVVITGGTGSLLRGGGLSGNSPPGDGGDWPAPRPGGLGAPPAVGPPRAGRRKPGMSPPVLDLRRP